MADRYDLCHKECMWTPGCSSAGSSAGAVAQWLWCSAADPEYAGAIPAVVVAFRCRLNAKALCTVRCQSTLKNTRWSKLTRALYYGVSNNLSYFGTLNPTNQQTNQLVPHICTPTACMLAKGSQHLVFASWQRPPAHCIRLLHRLQFRAQFLKLEVVVQKANPNMNC